MAVPVKNEVWLGAFLTEVDFKNFFQKKKKKKELKLIFQIVAICTNCKELQKLLYENDFDWEVLQFFAEEGN